MIVRHLIVVAAACSSGNPQPKAPTPAGSAMAIEQDIATPVAQPAPPPVATQQANAAKIIVQSSGAASRQPERPRVLRRILAERGGNVQFAKGYGRVGLTITKVTQGTLDDPDYAKRPVGTNHLSVVLLDDAAFASDDSMSGFEGTWKLTRMTDGTLVVGPFEDTPYPKSTKRRAVIDRTRTRLRASSADDRIGALDYLDDQLIFELVPDVIALLDDQRMDSAKPRPPGGGGRQGPRAVNDVAMGTLRRMMQPLADDRMPAGGDRASWQAFWQQLITPDTITRRTLDTQRTSIAAVPMNQSWPTLAAHAGGFVFGISGMQTPLDGHSDGIAVTRAPWTARTWLVPSERREALAVASQADGSYGVLSVTDDDTWKLSVSGPGTTSREVDLPLKKPASHATLVANEKGYVVAYLGGETNSFFTLAVDAAAKPRGPGRMYTLASEAEGGYHHGVFPISLTRKPSGYQVAIDSSDGIIVVTLDDNLAQVGAVTTLAEGDGGMPQPKIAFGRELALVVWEHDRRGRRPRRSSRRTPQLGYAIVDASGRLRGAPRFVGSEVMQVSRPVVLDDGGFAVAWVESEEEVHIGRWNAKGDFVSSAIIEPSGAIHFMLAIARDGKDLLVGYQDVARYPFTLVARRVDPSKI